MEKRKQLPKSKGSLIFVSLFSLALMTVCSRQGHDVGYGMALASFLASTAGFLDFLFRHRSR